MSSPDRRRFKEILFQARDLSPSDRGRFLQRTCGNDEVLRAEIEELLAHENRMPAIVRTGALLPETQGTERTEKAHPDRIAEYRILEVLGIGGMGVVYRAEQTEPIRREVALKRIRFGMRTQRVIARFEAERQTLAMMDHPCIAKVFDAGAGEDGHPFFAMELVPGDPITDYCRGRGLSWRDRLGLFLRVCRGVEHAHRKGIIHRDLKPSNLLVAEEDGGPSPRIIDFGIAVVVEDPGEGRTLHTEFGQLVGTPRYMSPEQATRPATMLDTRTDVYSLGVVLYELLADTVPYDTEHTSILEVVRVLRDEEPVPLRRHAAARQVDADLETVVAKALEKDPERRYQSAAALADDIERVLARQPILARPPTTTYQMKKLVSRHRVAFAFATTVLLLLVTLAVSMSVQAAAQRRERQRAELQARKAERISDFLRTMLGSANPTQARGHEVTVREVLDAAVIQADSALAQEPEVRASVQLTIGNTYRDLGLLAKAESLIRTALATRRDVLGADDPDVARSARDLSEVLLYEGKYDEGAESLRAALAIFETRGLGNGPEAAAALNDLGVNRYLAGDYDRAVEHLTRALEIRRATLGPRHADTGETVSNLATVLDESGGDLTTTEAYYREGLEIIRSRLGADHPDVANATTNLALNLKRQGRLDEAEALYLEALEVRRRVYGEKHEHVSGSLNNLGRLALARGHLTEADSLLEMSLEIRREIFDRVHPLIAESLHNLADVERRRGLPDDAERHYREALVIRRQLYPDHAFTAITLASFGDFLVQRGRPAEAEPLLRDAIAIRGARLGETHWVTAFTRGFLAHCLAVQGRREEAEALFLESAPLVLSSSEAGEQEKRTVLERFIALYEGWGRTEDAQRTRDRFAPNGDPAP